MFSAYPYLKFVLHVEKYFTKYYFKIQNTKYYFTKDYSIINDTTIPNT